MAIVIERGRVTIGLGGGGLLQVESRPLRSEVAAARDRARSTAERGIDDEGAVGEMGAGRAGGDREAGVLPTPLVGGKGLLHMREMSTATIVIATIASIVESAGLLPGTGATGMFGQEK